MTRLIAALLLTLPLALPAQAHEGHGEALGTEAAPAPGAAVELSDAATKNLGIETAPATLSPQADTLTVNATVEYLPERRAQLSPKIDGKVRTLLAKLGDKVTAGQPLVAIEPIFIGSPVVTLTAPISGAITAQNVVLGQSVDKDTTLLEIADFDKVLVGGKLFENQALRTVAAGQKITVTTPSDPGTTYLGAVQRIDTVLEPGSRTLTIYALVDNPAHKLLANMQAEMIVHVGDSQEVLTIPARAVLGEMGEYFAFVRNGTQFERRRLTLGKKYGDRVEVIEGILPDEAVVTVGNYQLQFAKPKPAPSDAQQSAH